MNGGKGQFRFQLEPGLIEILRDAGTISGRSVRKEILWRIKRFQDHHENERMIRDLLMEIDGRTNDTDIKTALLKISAML